MKHLSLWLPIRSIAFAPRDSNTDCGNLFHSGTISNYVWPMITLIAMIVLITFLAIVGHNWDYVK